MPYGTTAEVAELLPTKSILAGSDFTTSTVPTKASVETWLQRVSSLADGKLRSAGYDPSTVSASGLDILRDRVTSFVAGRVERIWAGVREGDPSDVGKDLQTPLLDMFVELVKSPASVALELELSTPSGSTSGTSLSSFHTDSADKNDTTVVPERSFKVTSKA